MQAPVKPGYHPVMLPGVLSNPMSGGNRKGLGHIRDVLSSYPQAIHREVHTLADVHSAMADFSKREVNLVIVNGGDGTVHGALTTLFGSPIFETPPFFAVLKAGTTSMIGGDVGLTGSPRQALRRLLHWVAKSETPSEILLRHILKIYIPRQDKSLCGTFLGAGSIYEGIRFFHRRVNTPGIRGELGPAITLVVFVLSLLRRQSKLLSTVPAQVTLDDHLLPKRAWLMLFATTLERLFLGMRPFWGKGSGKLHFTAITEHPVHFWPSLPFLVRGRRGPHVRSDNGLFSREISECRLKLTGGFTLDGELYDLGEMATELEIGIAGQVPFLRV